MRQWIHLVTVIAMFAASLPPCPAQESSGGEGEESRELRSVAEIRALREVTFNAEHPLALTGIVTWVHAGRNLLVVQDETGAVVLHPEVAGITAKPGQRVTVKAAGSSPYVANCPGFPFTPSGKAVLGSFETPENEGEYRLTRMRGCVRPPVTGDYTFWIASDDSSELWLSGNERPAGVNRVAFVPAGLWTGSREWLRFPTQRSEKIRLQAGKSYYIEALQEQAVAASHLAVAWEGPGRKLEIIASPHLVPWQPLSGEKRAEAGVDEPRGILREFWTDYSVARVGNLTSGSMAEGELAVRGLEVVPLDGGAWPVPRPIDPSVDLQPDDTYRWVEAGGVIRFAASEGKSAALEIGTDSGRVMLRVASWHGPLPPPGKHVRFRGVCEAGRDAGGRLMASSIWTPSQDEVSVSEASRETPPLPESDAPPRASSSVMGGGYFTRGVVTFSDEVLGKPCLVVQETLGGIFVSQEDRKPHPPLSVGHSVEIGGNLLQRKHSPAILPMSLNIHGWLNLPVPARPSTEGDYRDGLWSEMEGVVRMVNDDGTVLLMGKEAAIRAWVGHADRASLEKLVDSTLCLRGVMSLETFGGPLLLVPSSSYLEVREPAPSLPAIPAPIAELKDALGKGGWLHRTKVEGTVTYQNDSHFFLQDQTGAVRVVTSKASAVRPGAAVTVMGFPEGEGGGMGMSAATWTPATGARPPVAPVGLDPHQTAFSHHGELVKLEAHYLSRASRGADLVIELQAGGHVVEALLSRPDVALPFKAGSLVQVTGIGLWEPSIPTADHHGSSRFQILMREPQDMVLLEGPPWWNWQRTAALIGLLLVVLAGSLMRIHFLNRRFERQQAARLAFTRAMLESQESERRRIAASLHDSLGQELLVIRNQAHLALQSAPDALRQRLEEISGTTLQAIEEVREITRNLRPYQLDRLGLTQSIRALTRKVSENCPVEFASHVDEIDGLFDKESEIHIYRIVQEGINNVLKHSGATEAAVVVKKTTAGFSISIRDNGRGLPGYGSSLVAGFGLSGIKERAEIMNGTARMDSTSSQGVNLQVLLPLPATCETASKF